MMKLMPGTVVKLNKPFKPVFLSPFILSRLCDVSGVADQRQRHNVYTLWQGFTHGIVIDVLQSDDAIAAKLCLYDAYLALIYVDNPQDTPPRVQFDANEFSIEGI